MKKTNLLIRHTTGVALGLSALFNALPAEAAQDCTPSVKILQSGKASYYGKRFHGRQTANGETFNMNAMTAASRTLPFGTKVNVKYKNREVEVRINDRGPYAGGRILDLSKAAAEKLGLVHAGVGQVTLRLCY